MEADGSIPSTPTLDNIRIVYESSDFIAVDKPAGFLVHRTHHAGVRAEPTLAEWVLRRYPEVGNVGDDPVTRPGIVHRLDKETSGIMVIARTQTAFDHLKSLFQNRDIKKEYLALVWGFVSERTGAITKPISLKSGTVKRTVHEGKMEKEAITRYELKRHVERDGERYSLLSVFPETGRTHQIRVHLASIGHPVVGDTLYGRKREPAWVKRLMLHAFALSFQDQQGSSLRLEAEPPNGFLENNK